ncbi:hypothetical protein FRC03_008014 [Tulasnella sp. 419]|nr:hypothetical protein FRC03_008014 [Tulasnella sp. 419]
MRLGPWTATLLGAASASTALARSPPVRVSLTTSWNGTDFLTELLETLAIEEPDSYFVALAHLTHYKTFQYPIITYPDEVIYEKFVELSADRYLQNVGALASFERAFALRAASPRIEAFYQFYTEKYGPVDEDQDESCGAWIDFYGQKICTIDELMRVTGYECKVWEVHEGFRGCLTENIVIHEGYVPPKQEDQPHVLSFDHIYPPSNMEAKTPAATAILYGSVGSSNFATLHVGLLRLSFYRPSRLRYIYRPIPPRQAVFVRKPTYLSGYGVAMDLKKMDYLALDDRRSSGVLDNLNGAEQEVLEADLPESLQDPILSLLPKTDKPIDSTTPPTEAELEDLAFQVSQLILESPNPLQTLSHLTKNFPRYATSIVRSIKVNPKVKEALLINMNRAPPGTNMCWINGAYVSAEEMNPFGLLRRLRKERNMMQELTDLRLTPAQAVNLISHTVLIKDQGTKALEGIVDASDRQEGGGIIQWINNLEKDQMYSKWPHSVHALLHSYGGQMPSISRNVFNLVVSLDLTKPSSVQTLVTLYNLIQRKLPVRMGIVPMVETDKAIKVARLFYHLTKNWSLRDAVKTFQKATEAGWSELDFMSLSQEFAILLRNSAPTNADASTDFQWIINDAYSDEISRISKYHKRLEIAVADNKAGHAFFNGKYIKVDDQDWLRVFHGELVSQIHYLQELIQNNQMDDAVSDIANYFYDLPTSSRRRNRHIIVSDPAEYKAKSIPQAFGSVGFIPSDFVYSDDSTPTPATLWVIGSFNDEVTLNLLQGALETMKSFKDFRLSYVHVARESDTPQTEAKAKFLQYIMFSRKLNGMKPQRVLKLIELISSSSNSVDDLEAADEIFKQYFAADHFEEQFQTLKPAGQVFARELGLKEGETGLYVNGRVVGPIQAGDFGAVDIEELLKYELRTRILNVQTALEEVYFTEDMDRIRRAELVAAVTSIISLDKLQGLDDSRGVMPRRLVHKQLHTEHASFEIGNNETAWFHFGIVMDPLSDTGAKWSSLIEWLMEETDLFHFSVFLSPPAELKELPLKRFYQYNLVPRILFIDGWSTNSEVEFNNLPVDPIYTLAMDVPDSWLVRPKEAVHDLDNIHLAGLPPHERGQGIKAVYNLDFLIIDGHATDTTTKTIPRGLQLQLASQSGIPVTDTQIVANLGYFQLKAKPGIFKLEIRPGRGREIFEMESAGNEGRKSPSVAEAGSDVVVASFEDITLHPRFTRHPGMEKADVLDTGSEEGTVMSNIFKKVGSLFGSKETTAVEKPQADINIFTVASGLLYERFASIMILSVLKNTKSTVKFWFIENFLSPSFLEFIPHFAEEYGFEYELVTYKWPSWLRAQTEKQRIIWGYKILFLDVLFPMNLKKVIFVDADQIVRTDLLELVNLDLEGAPYGYTPMGDDSYDMENFRFWKTGYWKEHLKDKQYHISALYVVDLVRFRQMAAGDRLRVHYHALSADPNSLANLDQDLPNNMQDEVPIFSLPEDWLWCETWCSKDRLDRAKTIDLCQNPKTKEPKLSRARKIPEWESYDAEIASFAKRLAESGKIRSTAVAEDVNALAGESESKSKVPSAEQEAETSRNEHDEL